MESPEPLGGVGEAIADYSIFYRIAMFAVQPIVATSVAMLPFAALRVGAGDYSATRAGLIERLQP